MAQRALRYHVVIDGIDGGTTASCYIWTIRYCVTGASAQITGRPVALVDTRLPRYVWQVLAAAVAAWPGTLLAHAGHGAAALHSHPELAALAVAVLVGIAYLIARHK